VSLHREHFETRLDRRSFLAVGGAMLSLRAVDWPRVPQAAPQDVGIQLYTLREEMRRDFEGTLARVAQIGFGEVEFAGTFGRTARQVRAILDANGLTAPAAHVDLLAPDIDPLLDDAETIGNRYLVLPWLPVAMRNADGYRRTAAALNMAGEKANARGIAVAYHNHDFEFADVGGLPGLALLLEETAAHVRLELDLYWTAKAGQDPVHWMDRAGDRLRLIHAKDIAADGSMVDVGSGTLDFAALIEAGRAHGLEHVFVEHDEPPDAFATARRGYTHLRPLVR
jgi:sugar phosphate isomerase/epimerase